MILYIHLLCQNYKPQNTSLLNFVFSAGAPIEIKQGYCVIAIFVCV